MKMIKGTLSMLAVALMAVTFTACPPPEEDPAAFDGRDTVPATGESPGEAETPPRGTTPEGGPGDNGGDGGGV